MAQIISVYDKDETSFATNGYILSDVVSCEIEEVLNGKYNLELTHPIDEKGKWGKLVEENIIKADGQLFRINRTDKDLDYITVYARHIFYDLLSNFLEDVRPTNLNGAGAISWVLDGTQYPHPFTGTSDITGLATAYFIRKNPVEAILGTDGLTERWVGELERDNFQIRLWESRGEDKGAHIVYGKNMIGIEVDTNYDDVVTRLMPIGNNELTLPEKYVDSPLINNYAFPRIKTINFSIGIDEETTEEQAYQLMRDECNKLYSLNKLDLPYESITADLVLLENTEEYKNFSNLIKVELGDLVGCTDNPLNVTFSAKVVRVRKDVLTDRNVEIELGQIKRSYTNTLETVIRDISYELVNTKSDFQQAIENATDLLASALGGYVLKRAGELLIMDTEDPTTATKVWRWNLNGLGYSSNGINGPYELAMTIEGVINADFIATGTLSASLVKTGVLSSHDNSIWINLDNNSFNFNDQMYWDGANGTFKIKSSDGLMEIDGDNGFIAYKDSSKEEFTQLYPDGLYRVFVDGNTETKKEYFYERHVEIVNDTTAKEVTGGSFLNTTQMEAELEPWPTIQLPTNLLGKPFRIVMQPYLGDKEFLEYYIRAHAVYNTYAGIHYRLKDLSGNLWDGINLDTMPELIKTTGQFKIISFMSVQWNDNADRVNMMKKFRVMIDVIA